MTVTDEGAAYQLALNTIRQAAEDDNAYADYLRDQARTHRWPRWYRRSLTRHANNADARARSARRFLAEQRRDDNPPIIKKGLTK